MYKRYQHFLVVLASATLLCTMSSSCWKNTTGQDGLGDAIEEIGEQGSELFETLFGTAEEAYDWFNDQLEKYIEGEETTAEGPKHKLDDVDATGNNILLSAVKKKHKPTLDAFAKHVDERLKLEAALPKPLQGKLKDPGQELTEEETKGVEKKLQETTKQLRKKNKGKLKKLVKMATKKNKNGESALTEYQKAVTAEKKKLENKNEGGKSEEKQQQKEAKEEEEEEEGSSWLKKLSYVASIAWAVIGILALLII